MQRWQSLQCPQKYCPFVIFSYDIYFLILKLFLKTFFKVIEDKIPIKVPYCEILTVTALCCRTSKMTFKLHCQDNNVPNLFHSQKYVPFLMVFFFNGGLQPAKLKGACLANSHGKKKQQQPYLT